MCGPGMDISLMMEKEWKQVLADQEEEEIM